MKKIFLTLISACFAASSLQASLLFQDSTNYPYTNGCIEGQGQWYCYDPLTTPGLNAFVTNNTLLMVTQSTNDAVATPTNGWVNPTEFNFASFSLNVSQLPSSTNGGYFAQLQNINGSNSCCHLFIDTVGTVVPGTYRLGIANYATSLADAPPPHNYPVDLAPGVNYTIVMLFDTNQSSDLVGATLWINPSGNDFTNAVDGVGESYIDPGVGDGYVFGTDTTGVQADLDINVSQIGFSPYITAGISNVVAGTNFNDVNTTNLPLFGIQPQSQTNYSGNSTMFYAVASAVDETYQWYSESGGELHDDDVNIIGSTSNILILNNLSETNDYYVIVTDAYGNTVTSAIATNDVITTPTALFFTNAPVNLTNSLFTFTGFTNLAYGTGPQSYQWYFAPTNTPGTYGPLAGQTAPALNLELLNYSYDGNYFVVASNAFSYAYGPTNSLTELPPLNATILQLHNLEISESNLTILDKSSSYYINTNNVIVSGYVTSFQPMGTSASYAEYFMQDASGYGIEVYVGGVSDSNQPPVGTYITVSGPVEVYHTGLEMTPASLLAVITNVAPVVPLSPVLANGVYNILSTNALGTNALLQSCSLVTLTNVYIYGNKTGGAIGNGGIFYSNGYTSCYITIGPYHAPNNTNWMELFQPGENIGTNVNQFADQPVPTHCYQLTGVYIAYGGTPEIEPSRLADYVTNPPPAFTTSITPSGSGAALTWGPVQVGSTYSVNATTNLSSGVWTQPAFGLGYYPTNAAFTDTNPAPAKFYLISSP